MTEIPAVLRGALLSLPLALSLAAGVTYDQTVRTGDLDGSLPLKARVPGIDPPVFDIPVSLYAPPLRGASPVAFRIMLSGDRLARIGKDFTIIFDLKARTVTFVQRKTRSYRIETLDQAQQRSAALFQRWPSPFIPGPYKAEVRNTGQTRQLLGQTAEEYRIVAIGLLNGRRVVGGSSIYWMVPNVPSEELAAFRARWSRECTLPFPGGPSVPPVGDGSAFGAMAAAASKLAGYPALYVVESRPLPLVEKQQRQREPMYSAADNALPEVGASRPMSEPLDQLKIRVRETSFSGFVAGAADPSAFTVPAGYTEKSDLQYMPE